MLLIWNVEARRSLRQLADKTVTARHRETSDREDETSESLPVMGWIVIELLAILSQVKACPPSSGAFWQETS
jgi:hypothetical protein